MDFQKKKKKALNMSELSEHVSLRQQTEQQTPSQALLF